MISVFDNGLTVEVCEAYIYHEAVEPCKVFGKVFSRLPKGFKVLDLGANAGSFGLYLAHEYGAEVTAVEPFDVERLARNYQMNRLPLPRIIKRALWTNTDPILMGRPTTDGTVTAFPPPNAGLCEELPLGLEPEDLAKDGPWDVVKCDIEGSENALGARLRCLWDGAKVVVLESHNQLGPQGVDFQDMLKKDGLSVAVDGLKLFGVRDP
jgi:FkbM family methyltransferase